MIELLWQDAINRNADRADAERARRAAMIQAEKQKLAFEQEKIKEKWRSMFFSVFFCAFLVTLAVLLIAAINHTEAQMHCKQASDIAHGLGYLYGL